MNCALLHNSIPPWVGGYLWHHIPILWICRACRNTNLGAAHEIAFDNTRFLWSLGEDTSVE